MNERDRYLFNALTKGPLHINLVVAENLIFNILQNASNGDYKSYLEQEPTLEAKKDLVNRFISSYSAQGEIYIEDYYFYYPPFKVGSVLVIPINDVITQETYWGSAGTKTIQSWYEKAKNDGEIVGVLELSNTPGGSVFGTSELANYKANYPKPIVTLSEGMTCSAGYYIASPSKQILATSKSVLIGSVGVMTSFLSFQKYYQKMGIDYRSIYSTTSPKKNEAYRNAQKGNDKTYEEGILFTLDSHFMEFVKQFRPDISQRAMDGADMTADQALQEGLIDGICTFEEAIQKVQELAQSNTTTPQKTTKTMSKPKQYTFSTDSTIALKAIGALVDLKEVKEDGTNNEPNADAGAGAAATAGTDANQQPPVPTAASQPVPTATEAPEATKPDASIEASIKALLTPFMERLEKIETRQNQTVITSTPPKANNQQMVNSESKDDEEFTAVKA